MNYSNDGGSAFPVHGGNDGDDPRNMIIGGGMSLRDYFAAKAMHAQMLNDREMGYWAEEYSVDQSIQFCAEMAYRMADAMLKAREALPCA